MPWVPWRLAPGCTSRGSSILSRASGRFRGKVPARSPSSNLAGLDSGCASVERVYEFVNSIAEAPADILRTHLDPAQTGSHVRAYVRRQRVERLRHGVQPDLQRVEVGLVAVAQIRSLLRSSLHERQHEIDGPGCISR